MTQRTALVTGGTGGIGSAIIRYLAGQGHRVATNYRDPDKAEAWRKTLASEGIAVCMVPGDVTDTASCEAMVHAVTEQCGPVEILVNNAGITRDATFHKMTYQQWSEVMHTHLNACFNVTRPVIESMRARQWGRIVQISSINGQKGQFGQTNYAAAKAGMHGFSMALAQENARFGITVNTVSPGYVATGMVMTVPEAVREKIVAQIPAGRLGRPEEIAHAVAFLVSEEAGWITGSNLAINGGHYMG